MHLLTKVIGTFMPRLMAEIGEGTRVSGRIERRIPGGIIRIGRRSMISAVLVTERDCSRLTIGDNVFIAGGTVIDCANEITIESDVLISYRVIIMDSDNHSMRASQRVGDLQRLREGRYDWSGVGCKPVRVCAKAWIGAGSIITKGVEIGEGSVIGAGSVVTRSVAPYTVVAGNPARMVREIRENER